MVTDVTARLHEHRANQDAILFEGAQGVYLDIDHGTYPYVTSSNTCVGSVVNGAGFGPRYLDYILGVTKAYTTRVGGGPFLTELFNSIERFNNTASNHPQRRGRPVTAPNSQPRSAMRTPTSSNSSVRNGPPPTRVV